LNDGLMLGLIMQISLSLRHHFRTVQIVIYNYCFIEATAVLDKQLLQLKDEVFIYDII